MQDLEGYAEQIVCPHCGRKIEPGDDLAIVEGEFVCGECLEERYEECSYCGEYHPLDEMMMTNDGDVCLCCLENHYKECLYCEEYYPFDEMTMTNDGDVCSRCLEYHYEKCHECGNYLRTSDMMDDYYVTHDGSYICDECYRNSYFTCEHCEGVYHHNDRIEQNGQYFCPDCAEGQGIYSYHDFHGYSPRRLDTELNENLYLGVELECERGSFRVFDFSEWENNGHLVHFERDGSLSSGGVEMITQPCTLRYHQEKMKWEALCGILKSQGYRSSFEGSNCGLHVHFSRYAVQPMTIVKLDVFVNRAYELLWQISRRKDFYGDHYNVGKCADKEKRFKDGEHDNRYTAVNTTNAKTVEIRIFKGTLNPETVLGTIELVHAMIMFISNVSVARIYKTMDNVLGLIGFVAENHKTYPHVLPMMHRLVKEGEWMKSAIESNYTKIYERKNSKCA